MCDTSYDESQFQTDESLSSDSESDFDLSDPEAESQQLSQDDLSKTMISLHLMDKVMKMKRVEMVSLGVMTTILILLVTATVGVLVLLREHATVWIGPTNSKNYTILRQTRKYWKTLFLHYVVVNAYILYKELHPNARLRMSHFTFRETLVRQLCHIEVSLHQSVAGRKCDTTIEHRFERMVKGRDCVYCKLVYGVRRRTTRQCSKCEAPLCLLA